MAVKGNGKNALGTAEFLISVICSQCRPVVVRPEINLFVSVLHEVVVHIDGLYVV